MPIEATNDFIYVIRDSVEKEKEGLFIPSQGVVKPPTGEIISVGELVQDSRIVNGVGKKAVFNKGSGFEIDYENVTYLILTANQIIGVDASGK